jgi:hypothetical protein
MAAFGKQFQQFTKDVTNRRDMGGDPPSRLRAIMQVVISLIILGAGFYTLFVVVDASEATQKTMTTLMGSVVGYWLR